MTARNKKAHLLAIERRRFILAVRRDRPWYKPPLSTKDLLRVFGSAISERTLKNDLTWLRRKGYMDVYEEPPNL